MMTQNLRLTGSLLLVAFILLIPVMAGFPWTSLDYIFAGVILTSTVLACELVLRKVFNRQYRIFLIIGILTMLLLIWAWAVAGP